MPLTDLERANFREHTHLASQIIDDETEEPIEIGGGSGQPLDSDLTAIAALSTTSYGRSLLTLADQAALQAAVGLLYHGWGVSCASAPSVSTSGDVGIPFDTDVWDTDAYHFTSNANLTGTVSKTSASATITGSSTLFTSELSVGQVVIVPGTNAQRFTVASIADNTHFTAYQLATDSASGQTAQRASSCISIPAGQAGRYQIGVAGAMTGTATQADVNIYKGGKVGSTLRPSIYLVAGKRQSNSVFGTPTYSASMEIDLVEGDILEIGGLAQAATTLLVNSGIAIWTGRRIA